MIAYQQRIRNHMDQLAMAHPSNHFTETLQSESENSDPVKLFDIIGDAERGKPVYAAVLDSVAQQLGGAGKSAMAEWAPQIGNAAWAAANSQWSRYWHKAPVNGST